MQRPNQLMAGEASDIWTYCFALLAIVAPSACSSNGSKAAATSNVESAGVQSANGAGAVAQNTAVGGASGDMRSQSAGSTGNPVSVGASGMGGNTSAGMSGAVQAGTGAGVGGTASAGRGGMGAQGGTDASGTGAGGGQGGETAGAGGAGANAHKKFVGNITTNGQVRSDFAMYWDQITPENEGKWGSVEGTRNQMNWTALDRIHDYAKAHGVVFKQHNFVWGAQQPSWLNGLSDADQRAEVEEWIRLFCERYPDVALIDVVNEPPPHTMPVYMNALGGAGSSGYDWIVQAFKWAHQYCPNATLILNDYNNLEYANDNSHFIDIVTRIKSAGAPIDAIGAQSHDVYKLSASTVQGFLQKLEATGLPVYITEYDINLASDTDQQKAMASQFPLFWKDDHVAGITLWGYVVGATWETNTGLLNTNGTERPAMKWLMDYLGR